MTQHHEIFAALMAPFDPDEVKHRAQAGRQFSYITARTAMNRLDDVLGPENWWDAYVPTEHSVICSLTIRLPDGQVITKADAGGYAGMSDPGDDDKSGYSDAFKRAAVKFGVGRYLYRDGLPSFASAVHRVGDERPREAQPQRNDHSAATPSRTDDGDRGVPRSGRALFAWTKDQDEKHEYGLLKHLNVWGKRQEFPARMVDWEGEQVTRAYAEACRKIRAIQAMGRDAERAMEN